MSERAFFSLRHAIPGFTFVVLIVLINIIPASEILNGTPKDGVESGIFIGFLSLLSGPAFGFLISQIWWLIFQAMDADWRLAPDAFTAFLRRYNLEKPESHKDKEKMITVLDYILHCEGYREEMYGSDTMKGIFRYIERRWDLFHTLCSELVTLFFGLIFGVWPIRLMLFDYITWTNIDTKIVMILIPCVFILALILIIGIFRVRSQHNILSTVVIKTTQISLGDLASIFPIIDEYRKR